MADSTKGRRRRKKQEAATAIATEKAYRSSTAGAGAGGSTAQADHAGAIKRLNALASDLQESDPGLADTLRKYALNRAGRRRMARRGPVLKRKRTSGWPHHDPRK
jgi:hypothetical protein